MEQPSNRTAMFPAYAVVLRSHPGQRRSDGVPALPDAAVADYPPLVGRLTAADASPAKHTVRVQLLSERASRLENVSTYQSHGTSAVRLAHGHGEAHAYLLQFEPGGAIGRHEAGYGQLFIVLTGRGWVSGHDGPRGGWHWRRGPVGAAESTTPRAATLG